MTQNENENKIIAKVLKEYQGHIAAGRRERFSLSPEAAAGLSRLTRELEQKRQIGRLTANERSLQREMDDLVERIAKFNANYKSIQSEEYPGNWVYDLGGGRVLEESRDPGPMIVPKISQAEAEKIIEGLNKQFEEKVMRRLKRAKADKVQQDRGVEPSETAVEPAGGRNLQEYLTSVKRERPKVPFADKDSQFDISKLVSGNRKTE